MNSKDIKTCVDLFMSKDMQKKLRGHARAKGISLNDEVLFRLSLSLEKEDGLQPFERMKRWLNETGDENF